MKRSTCFRLASLAGAAALVVSTTARAQFAFSDTIAGTFIDISGTAGTPLTGDDASTQITVSSAASNAAFPAGSLGICTNGHVGYGTDTQYTNFALPSAGFYAGGTAAAVHFDDLITQAGAGAGVYSQEVVVGGVPVLIVQWNNMDHFATSPSTGTFQLQIYGGGTGSTGTGPGGCFAQYVYQDVDFGDVNSNGASATIAFQVNGTTGSQYSFNAASIHDGSTVSLVAETTGACCLPSGTCLLVGSGSCTNQGGVYQGANTSCGTVNCPVNPCAFVTNGGFETGSFSGWTQFGNTGFSAVNAGVWVIVSPHGGTYESHFGPVGSTGGIQQTITASAGQMLTIDFWYACNTTVPNFFSADVDGTNLVTFTDDTSHPDWTHFVFNIPAPANNPTLTFTAQHDPQYVYLDDIIVCVQSQPPACYANCDTSTQQPCLNVLDFTCFLNSFAAASTYANCDASTQPPVLNVLDFTCFLNRFAAGCSGC